MSTHAILPSINKVSEKPADEVMHRPAVSEATKELVLALSLKHDYMRIYLHEIQLETRTARIIFPTIY